MKAERTAARHDETPTESGCLFAFALVIALALILIAPAVLA
jgi:hypothetical protein